MQLSRNILLYWIKRLFINTALNIYYFIWVLVIYDFLWSLNHTILFYIIHYIWIIVIYLLFMKHYYYLIKKIWIKSVIFLWILILSLFYYFLFIIINWSEINLFILYLLWVFKSVWNILFYNSLWAFKLSIIWSSKKPATMSAFFSSTWLFSYFLSTSLTIILLTNQNISHLFLISLLCLLISWICLLFIKPNNVKIRYSKNKLNSYLSPLHFFTTMEFTYEMKKTVIPLYIFITIWSLSKSILITSLTAILTIIFLFLISYKKDKWNNSLLYFILPVSLLSRISYIFVDSIKLIFNIMNINMNYLWDYSFNIFMNSIKNSL